MKLFSSFAHWLRTGRTQWERFLAWAAGGWPAFKPWLRRPAGRIAVKPFRPFSEGLENRELMAQIGFAQTSFLVSEAAGEATIAVLRDDTEGPATVWFTTSDGSATSGQDYTSLSTSVNFDSGVSIALVSVSVLLDSILESPETVNLSLATASAGYDLGLSTATLTIEDATRSIWMASSSYSVTEADGYATVTLYRDTTSGTASVWFYTYDGTATSGQDYSFLNTPVVFYDGTDTATVSVAVYTDSYTEPSETVYLSLFTPSSGYALNLSTATLTLEDSTPHAIWFSTATYFTTEANGYASITLERDTTFGTATVWFTTNGGSATAYSDYAPEMTQVTFYDGMSTALTTVSVYSDSYLEGDETVGLSLWSPSGNYGLGLSWATLTIQDSTNATIWFSSSTYLVGEAAGYASVTVYRDTTVGTATVWFQTSDGTASSGNDYSSLATSVTFWEGSNTAFVTISVIYDALTESDETVQLSLSSPSWGYDLGLSTASLTILDAPPQLISFDTAHFWVTESVGLATITLSRTSSQGTATVWFSSWGGSASWDDFTSLSTSVYFADGISTASVTMSVNADSVVEPDETAQMALFSPSDGYGLGLSSATLTIQDSSPSHSMWLATGTYVATEDEGYVTITVLRDTTQGTATAWLWPTGVSATYGEDFTFLATAIMFYDGTDVAFATVTILSDSIPEPNETANFSLTTPSDGYTLGLSVATLTILDVTPHMIWFSTPTYFTTETSGYTTIALVRDTINGTASVWFSTYDGTAQAGSDYTSLTTAATFYDGTSVAYLTVPVLSDSNVEGDETVNLTIWSSSSGYSLGLSSATLTISETMAHTISFATTTYTVDESSGMASITLVRDTTFGSASVWLTAWDGSATMGSDYSLGTACIYFYDGSSTAIAYLPIYADGIAELNETVNLGIMTASAGYSLGLSSATLTIADNTPGHFSLSSASYAVSEGEGGITISVLRDTSFGTASVWLYASNGSAVWGDDFAYTSTQVNFADGATVGWAFVPIYADAITEPDEYFYLSLMTPSAGYTISLATATVTIHDDSQTHAIWLSSAAYQATEASGAAFITVYRDTTEGSASVSLWTSNLTAVAGQDYQPVFATVTFESGQSSATVAIPILTDSIVELDESVGISLGMPSSGYNLGLSTATLTVLDSAERSVWLDATAITVMESVGTATVTLRRSTTVGAVDVWVHTWGESAGTWYDFQPFNGPISFADGSETATVAVGIYDDSYVENNEVFHVAISSVPSGYSLGNSDTAITILDNDLGLPPILGAAPSTEVEVGRHLLAGSGTTAVDGDTRFFSPVGGVGGPSFNLNDLLADSSSPLSESYSGGTPEQRFATYDSSRWVRSNYGSFSIEISISGPTETGGTFTFSEVGLVSFTLDDVADTQWSSQTEWTQTSQTAWVFEERNSAGVLVSGDHADHDFSQSISGSTSSDISYWIAVGWVAIVADVSARNGLGLGFKNWSSLTVDVTLGNTIETLTRNRQFTDSLGQAPYTANDVRIGVDGTPEQLTINGVRSATGQASESAVRTQTGLFSFHAAGSRANGQIAFGSITYDESGTQLGSDTVTGARTEVNNRSYSVNTVADGALPIPHHYGWSESIVNATSFTYSETTSASYGFHQSGQWGASGLTLDAVSFDLTAGTGSYTYTEQRTTATVQSGSQTIFVDDLDAFAADSRSLEASRNVNESGTINATIHYTESALGEFELHQQGAAAYGTFQLASQSFDATASGNHTLIEIITAAASGSGVGLVDGSETPGLVGQSPEAPMPRFTWLPTVPFTWQGSRTTALSQNGEQSYGWDESFIVGSSQSPSQSHLEYSADVSDTYLLDQTENWSRSSNATSTTALQSPYGVINSPSGYQVTGVYTGADTITSTMSHSRTSTLQDFGDIAITLTAAGDWSPQGMSIDSFSFDYQRDGSSTSTTDESLTETGTGSRLESSSLETTSIGTPDITAQSLSTTDEDFSFTKSYESTASRTQSGIHVRRHEAGAWGDTTPALASFAYSSTVDSDVISETADGTLTRAGNGTTTVESTSNTLSENQYSGSFSSGEAKTSSKEESYTFVETWIVSKSRTDTLGAASFHVAGFAGTGWNAPNLVFNEVSYISGVESSTTSIGWSMSQQLTGTGSEESDKQYDSLWETATNVQQMNNHEWQRDEYDFSRLTLSSATIDQTTAASLSIQGDSFSSLNKSRTMTATTAYDYSTETVGSQSGSGEKGTLSTSANSNDNSSPTNGSMTSLTDNYHFVKDEYTFGLQSHDEYEESGLIVVSQQSASESGPLDRSFASVTLTITGGANFEFDSSSTLEQTGSGFDNAHNQNSYDNVAGSNPIFTNGYTIFTRNESSYDFTYSEITTANDQGSATQAIISSGSLNGGHLVLPSVVNSGTTSDTYEEVVTTDEHSSGTSLTYSTNDSNWSYDQDPGNFNTLESFTLKSTSSTFDDTRSSVITTNGSQNSSWTVTGRYPGAPGFITETFNSAESGSQTVVEATSGSSTVDSEVVDILHASGQSRTLTAWGQPEYLIDSGNEQLVEHNKHSTVSSRESYTINKTTTSSYELSGHGALYDGAARYDEITLEAQSSASSEEITDGVVSETGTEVDIYHTAFDTLSSVNAGAADNFSNAQGSGSVDRVESTSFSSAATYHVETVSETSDSRRLHGAESPGPYGNVLTLDSVSLDSITFGSTATTTNFRLSQSVSSSNETVNSTDGTSSMTDGSNYSTSTYSTPSTVGEGFTSTIEYTSIEASSQSFNFTDHREGTYHDGAYSFSSMTADSAYATESSTSSLETINTAGHSASDINSSSASGGRTYGYLSTDAWGNSHEIVTTDYTLLVIETVVASSSEQGTTHQSGGYGPQGFHLDSLVMSQDLSRTTTTDRVEKYDASGATFRITEGVSNYLNDSIVQNLPTNVQSLQIVESEYSTSSIETNSTTESLVQSLYQSGSMQGDLYTLDSIAYDTDSQASQSSLETGTIHESGSSYSLYAVEAGYAYPTTGVSGPNLGHNFSSTETSSQFETNQTYQLGSTQDARAHYHMAGDFNSDQGFSLQSGLYLNSLESASTGDSTTTVAESGTSSYDSGWSQGQSDTDYYHAAESHSSSTFDRTSVVQSAQQGWTSKNETIRGVSSAGQYSFSDSFRTESERATSQETRSVDLTEVKSKFDFMEFRTTSDLEAPIRITSLDSKSSLESSVTHADITSEADALKSRSLYRNTSSEGDAAYTLTTDASSSSRETYSSTIKSLESGIEDHRKFHHDIFPPYGSGSATGSNTYEQSSLSSFTTLTTSTYDESTNYKTRTTSTLYGGEDAPPGSVVVSESTDFVSSSTDTASTVRKGSSSLSSSQNTDATNGHYSWGSMWNPELSTYKDLAIASGTFDSKSDSIRTASSKSSFTYDAEGTSPTSLECTTYREDNSSTSSSVETIHSTAVSFDKKYNLALLDDHGTFLSYGVYPENFSLTDKQTTDKTIDSIATVDLVVKESSTFTSNLTQKGSRINDVPSITSLVYDETNTNSQSSTETVASLSTTVQTSTASYTNDPVNSTESNTTSRADSKNKNEKTVSVVKVETYLDLSTTSLSTLHQEGSRLGTQTDFSSVVFDSQTDINASLKESGSVVETFTLSNNSVNSFTYTDWRTTSSTYLGELNQTGTWFDSPSAFTSYTAVNQESYTLNLTQTQFAKLHEEGTAAAEQYSLSCHVLTDKQTRDYTFKDLETSTITGFAETTNSHKTGSESKTIPPPPQSNDTAGSNGSNASATSGESLETAWGESFDSKATSSFTFLQTNTMNRTVIGKIANTRYEAGTYSPSYGLSLDSLLVDKDSSTTTNFSSNSNSTLSGTYTNNITSTATVNADLATETATYTLQSLETFRATTYSTYGGSSKSTLKVHYEGAHSIWGNLNLSCYLRDETKNESELATDESNVSVKGSLTSVTHIYWDISNTGSGDSIKDVTETSNMTWQRTETSYLLKSSGGTVTRHEEGAHSEETWGDREFNLSCISYTARGNEIKSLEKTENNGSTTTFTSNQFVVNAPSQGVYYTGGKTMHSSDNQSESISCFVSTDFYSFNGGTWDGHDGFTPSSNSSFAFNSDSTESTTKSTFARSSETSTLNYSAPGAALPTSNDSVTNNGLSNKTVAYYDHTIIEQRGKTPYANNTFSLELSQFTFIQDRQTREDSNVSFTSNSVDGTDYSNATNTKSTHSLTSYHLEKIYSDEPSNPFEKYVLDRTDEKTDSSSESVDGKKANRTKKTLKSSLDDSTYTVHESGSFRNGYSLDSYTKSGSRHTESVNNSETGGSVFWVLGNARSDSSSKSNTSLNVVGSAANGHFSFSTYESTGDTEQLSDGCSWTGPYVSNSWSEFTETLDSGSDENVTRTSRSRVYWSNAGGTSSNSDWVAQPPQSVSVMSTGNVAAAGSLSGDNAAIAMALALVQRPQPSYLDSSGSGLNGPPIVTASQTPLPSEPLASFVPMPVVSQLTESLRREPPFLQPLTPGLWGIHPAEQSAPQMHNSGYIWYGSSPVNDRLNIPLTEWAQPASTGQLIDQFFISIIGSEAYGGFMEFMSSPVVKIGIQIVATAFTAGASLPAMLAVQGFAAFVSASMTESGVNFQAGALAAASTVFTMGLGSAVSTFSSWLGNRLIVDVLASAAVGMAGNAASQGLNIYFGNQTTFSWDSVLISGLTAAGGTLVARGASRMFDLTRSSGAASCAVSQSTFVAVNALAHGVGGTLTNAAAQYIVTGSVNWNDAISAGIQDAVMGGISARQQYRYNRACFRGHTKLMARGTWGTGFRRIDQITTSDEVLSRNEFDVTGGLEWKKVEQLFVRTANIRHLHVKGQRIDTTAEHPFYVKDRGWIPAGDLQTGDLCSSHDGQWVPVEEMHGAGSPEQVFNLRVADFHTYFVGDDTWQFSVWVHNNYSEQRRDSTGRFLTKTGEEAAPGSRAVNRVARQLKKEGYTVLGKERQFTNKEGDVRRYDLLVEKNGEIFGVEVKSGTARKNGAQRAFDNQPAAEMIGVGKARGTILDGVLNYRVGARGPATQV